METPQWYKNREYPHFDKPLSIAAAIKLVENKQEVEKHAFLPFIKWQITERRYKRKLHRTGLKCRSIACAAHTDSHIFAYYASLLNALYEEKLATLDIGDCVLAYRRFGGKCNIHFAQEAFEHIKSLKSCRVMALDVKGFFDNIDHLLLKKAWCQLLGVSRLPKDHYVVYKAMTRYAYVNKDALYKEFEIGRRRAAKLKGSICSPLEFRTKVRAGNLINVHTDTYGIPQGSPISAVLSNLYLLSFDIALSDKVKECGGLYRRYSDDILVVCPLFKDCCLDFIKEHLHKLKLDLSEDKTTITNLGKDESVTKNTSIQYLGLELINGQILIRHKAIARYQRRMKESVRSTIRAANKAKRKGSTGEAYKRKLYERFTHLSKNSSYPQYIKRASRITSSEAITKQHRNHWQQLHDLLKHRR
ncbi:MAG: antiviral reverse transcriptase Drt2 [Armatimonadota bacterium]